MGLLAAKVDAMLMGPSSDAQLNANLGGRDASQPIIQFPEEEGQDGGAAHTRDIHVTMTVDMLAQMQRLQAWQGASASYGNGGYGPRPSDMIPALQGLPSLQVSFGLVNDVSMVPTGVPYTYDNKRSGRANVWVRLDRVVACSAWRYRFAKTSIKHLTSPVSDHFPVLVEMQQEVRLPRRAPRRQYEILWERESELGERMAVAWGEAGQKSDLADIMNSLSHVMTMLQGWSKWKFGNVLRELDKARKNLETLQLNNAGQQEIRQATDHMQEQLYKEEML
ncbi:hypothetical protein ACQ4PT_022889 [Festuca glaucescens]